MGNDSSKPNGIQEWNSYLENSKSKFNRFSLSRSDVMITPIDPNVGFTFDEFEFLSELGSGAFADVFLATHKVNRNFLAMKLLNKRKVLEKQQEDHVNTERQLLGQLDLPFIIKFHLSFQTNATLCLGLEYVPGGELFTLLRQKRTFNEKNTRFYTAQVIIALEYMHNLDIVYRDLKPENILMDSRGYLKIADLGFAKIVPKRTYTMCGTPEYIAPEILTYKGYGKAVDWWALGILVYEMLCGISPFYSDEVMDIYSNIIEAKVRFPRELLLSRAARHLIKHLLEKNLTKRYGTLHAGVADIRDHPWFAEFDWVAIFEAKVSSPFKVSISKPTKADKSQLKKLMSLRQADLDGPVAMATFNKF